MGIGIHFMDRSRQKQKRLATTFSPSVSLESQALILVP
jgi:hypothetical protein